MHHHMSRQSKARRNIIPQCHLTETQQNTDCYDHHHLCHVQQPTPCSRDHHLHLNNTDIDTVKHRAYHLRQAPSTKETIHCYFCPNFQGQGPRLRMNNVDSDPLVQHHEICHNRHKSQHIHLQSRSRSSESSEDEEHRYHTEHYHTQGIQSNERQHHPPTVKHVHSKSSNSMFDHGHHHAATPAQSTCAHATVFNSHDDGCGSNMKAVRFEEDDRPETHHSDCPIHGTPSHGEDRWVWGPPLPVVAPRREKTYYAERY
ncbi:hypothetical protein PROQFM164_S02g002192 [Penicillium roqueforti FM164]|uniref:Uncharacterized protein n=1 Tax=Penicillium roqueforti (strain FM164) TaxID=1365484 RepID=W6Q7Q4_PENRF|nr:hypothetical protein PROQFM164_S02g002192 [Penicillium roqueforti FM164]